MERKFFGHSTGIQTLFNKIPAVAVNGEAGEDTREVQWFCDDKDGIGAYIGDEYTWKPHSGGFEGFKTYTKLIQTDIEFRRRFVEGGGINSEFINRFVSQKAEQHLLARDEFVFYGKSNIPSFNPLGKMVSTANSSINNPASCETTPGTIEPVTGSPAGSQRATMWGMTFDIQIKKLFNLKINTKTHKQLIPKQLNLIALIHPVALDLLDWTLWDGVQYTGVSNRQYLEAHGWTFVPTILADSDYAGAEDGTTQIQIFANVEDNFRTGVLKPMTWDSWARTEKGGDYYNKLSEIVTAMSIPFYDDDGYYYKAFLEAQIIPFDDSA